MENQKEKENGDAAFLRELAGAMEKLAPLDLASLDPARSVLLIVDMINGFTREGPLRSDRVAGMIPAVAALSKACGRLGIPRIAFADTHTPACPEFASFPPHCLAGTSEAEMVDELREEDGYVRIAKNSTNALHEAAFLDWLAAHPRTDTFLVAGCCTDICVLQLATALKTRMNARNRASRVIVPRSTVETYDLPGHPAGATGLFALYLMRQSGVELVSAVR